MLRFERGAGEPARVIQNAAEVLANHNMQSRTHLALEKDAPISRPVVPSSSGRIVVTPHVGGLHHRYDRAAA